VPSPTACYPCFVVSTFDRLSDLAPERVRPLKRVEFERLIEDGVFDEDERIELLDGVLVEVSPQGTLHSAAIMQLSERLTLALSGRARVRTQLPFAASDDSLPEPDLALVPLGDYRKANPDKAFLIVEVANDSLRKDRRLKGELYARAGIAEYWIVNVVDTCVERYTTPQDGWYATVARANVGETLRIEAFPNVEVAVSDIFAA
jgi:Uma2 family endonuclease